MYAEAIFGVPYLPCYSSRPPWRSSHPWMIRSLCAIASQFASRSKLHWPFNVVFGTLALTVSCADSFRFSNWSESLSETLIKSVGVASFPDVVKHTLAPWNGWQAASWSWQTALSSDSRAFLSANSWRGSYTHGRCSWGSWVSEVCRQLPLLTLRKYWCLLWGSFTRRKLH